MAAATGLTTASSSYPGFPPHQPGYQPGYQPPTQPGYGGPLPPPTAPGPTGGPPWGGPPWGGPPPPPPSRGGGPGRWIAIAIAAVVVTGLVGFGIYFASTSGDPSDQSATTASTKATKTTSSRSRTSTSRRPSSTSRPTTPTQGGGSDQARLISLLPKGIDPGSCKPIDLKGTLARLQCDGDGTSGAPNGGLFALFASQVSLDGGFDGTLTNFPAEPCPDGSPSPRAWTYEQDPNTPAGQIACVSYDESPGVTWTSNRDLVLGYVIGEDIQSLYDWWFENG